MNAETLTLLTAIWGAITGTIALAIQVLQHLLDRPAIRVFAKMYIASNAEIPRPHFGLSVEVINKGRRPAMIEKVAVDLPRPKGEETGAKCISSETQIFESAKSGHHIEVVENDKKTFSSEPFPEPFAEKIYDSGERGLVTVTLAHGQEIKATFRPIHPRDLEVMKKNES